MPDRLGEALARLPVPDSSARRAAVIRAESSASRPASAAARPRRMRRAAAALAVGLMIAAGLTLTPPGRALSSDIGELVGIGGQPSDPVKVANDGQKSELGVIGTGQSPNGTEFELATTTRFDPGRAESRETCVYLSFPAENAQSNSLSCLTQAALRDLDKGTMVRPYASIGPGLLGEQGDLMVSFVARPEVARVDISYPLDGEERSAVVTTAPFAAGAAAVRPALDASRGKTPLQFGVAFLPSTPLGEPRADHEPDVVGPRYFLDRKVVRTYLNGIQVRGYDANGELVHESSLGEIPNLDIVIAAYPQGRFEELLDDRGR